MSFDLLRALSSPATSHDPYVHVKHRNPPPHRRNFGLESRVWRIAEATVAAKHRS